MQSRKLLPYKDYLATIIIVGLAIVGSRVINIHAPGQIFSVFILLILCIALFTRGIGPSLFATGLSTLALAYFVLTPIHSIRIDWNDAQTDFFAIYLLMAIVINVFVRYRLQSQEAQRRYIERIYDLYHKSPCGHHVLDMNGIITDINDTELKWLKRKREDVVGCLSIQDFLPCSAQERFRALWQTFLSKGVIRDFETEFVRLNGTTFPVLINASAVRDKANRIESALVTVYDLSERIAVEQERYNRRIAEEANRTKSEFLSTMSHEIRTPLAAIVGFSDFLAEKDLDSEEKAKYVSVIQRNSHLLASLIDDVLDLAKIDSGRLTIHQEMVKISVFINETIGLLEHHAAAKGVRVTVDIAHGVVEQISTDPLRLRQILINLIGNSIKFTDSGGQVKVKLRQRTANLVKSNSSADLVVSVQDTGMGIPYEMQKLLFQPFVQAIASAAQRRGGTGLGLYLSRNFARALGGELFLGASVPQRGSTFTLVIPIVTPPLLPVSMPRSLGQAPASACLSAGGGALQGLRVLVVEDSSDHQELIHHTLTKAGCQVRAIGSGEECLAITQREQFDLIIIDIQLPNIDGWEVTTLLRQRLYAKPIIAVSAFALPEDRQRSLSVGCNEHLSKPLDCKKLLTIIGIFTCSVTPSKLETSSA